jgi:hypothetical protein
MIIRPLRTIAVSFISLAATAAAASAQLTFEYGVDLSVEDAVLTDRIVNQNAAMISLDINNPPWGAASGRSHVSTGVNKAAITLNLTSTAAEPVVIGYANAYAYWYDRVTINNPDLNGTTGSFTTSMLVNGAGSVSAGGAWLADPTMETEGVWHAFVGVFLGDDTFQEDGWYGYWGRDTTTGQIAYEGAPLGQVQAALTFDFIFGEPFTLSGRLQTYFDLFNPEASAGTLDVNLDLSNSAYWGGISAIRNGLGQVVTNSTITSASGVQWGNGIDPRVLLGDFDASGQINIADFSMLAARFNEAVTPWTAGDATGDGRVSIADFSILAAHFNQASGVSASPARVPEPAALAIAAAMATVLMGRRRC